MRSLPFKVQNLTKGFTLIELLVVIAIIGILATFLVSNFNGVRARARDAQRKSDIKQLQAALEFYRSDNGGYPTALTQLTTGTTKYLQSIPSDPSSGSYGESFTTTFTNANGVTVARRYCLRACLENANDSQKDSGTAPSQCSGVTLTCTSGFSVINP